MVGAIAGLAIAVVASSARADEPIAGELAVAPGTALALRGDVGWLRAETVDGVGAGVGVEGRWAPLPALFVGLAVDGRMTWLADDTGTAAGRAGLARVGLGVGSGGVIGSVALGARIAAEATPALLGLEAIDAGVTELVLRGVLEIGWRGTRYALRAALDGGAGVDDGASAFFGGRVDATRAVGGVVSSLAGLELRGGLGVGLAFRGRLGVVLATQRASWRVAFVLGAGAAEPLVLGLEVGVVFAQPTARTSMRRSRSGGVSAP